MNRKIINETQFRGIVEECVRRVSQAMKPLNVAELWEKKPRIQQLYVAWVKERWLNALHISSVNMTSKNGLNIKPKKQMTVTKTRKNIKNKRRRN